MSLVSLSDHSVTLLYENIKQQVEADQPSKYHFTTTPLIKERAEELRNEMMRRRLPHSPIDHAEPPRLPKGFEPDGE